MNYKQKYLKYKNKYLNLQKKNMIGGFEKNLTQLELPTKKFDYNI